MNEKQIQAQFNTLVEQRNFAANQVVNQAGEIAVLQEKIKELEGKLTAKEAAEVEIVGDAND